MTSSQVKRKTSGEASLPTPVTPSSSRQSPTTRSSSHTATSLSTSLSSSSLTSLHCATPIAGDPLDALRSPNSTGAASDISRSILSPEIVSVAEFLGGMKRTLGVLNSTFDALTTQTERVATLGPTIKAGKQLAILRDELRKRVESQELDIKQLRQTLQAKVKHAVENSLKERVNQKIEVLLSGQLDSKVKDLLHARIAGQLQALIQNHTRQLIEIQMYIFNSEARRFNSTLRPGSKVALRPLLRPLSSSFPIETSAREEIDDLIKPSPLFPSNVKALFELNAEDARKLVDYYSITPKAEESGDGEGRDSGINNFMAFIGVFYRVRNAPHSVSSSNIGQRLGPRLVTACGPQ